MSDFFCERFSSQKSSRRRAGLIRNYHQKIFIGPLVGLLAVVFFAPMTAAASDQVGKVVLINNASAAQTLTIVRTWKKGPVRGKQGEAVFGGDTIKTGTGVKAQIVLADESVLDIGPESALRIKAFIQDQAQGTRNYTLKALKGTIRFTISKMNKVGSASIPWRDSHVAIETPTAVIRVEGTEFAVASNPEGSVDVAVFEGTVSVRNRSLSVQGTVTLARNQFTRVPCGVPPAPPLALSAQRSDLLASLTTLNQNPGKAYQAAKSGTPAGKYTNDDVARDIAAGQPVSDVLDQAAGSGMTVDQMVSAAEFAGVDPGTVVYTAIQGGYSTEAVVASAIENGALLDDVVAMAITAGGDISAVVTGAAEAGVSPSDAATAVANAACSPLPVYVYSPLTNVDIIPAAPASISDGGGVATRSASPSAP